MVESDIMNGFLKFLVFWNQRLKPYKHVPNHFFLSRFLKKVAR